MFDPLCESCKQKMSYAVVYRLEGTYEWKYFHNGQPTQGKDAAYELVKMARNRYPATTEWRVFTKSVADMLMYGMKVGKLIAEEEGGAKPKRKKRRPIRYLPENI